MGAQLRFTTFVSYHDGALEIKGNNNRNKEIRGHDRGKYEKKIKGE